MPAAGAEGAAEPSTGRGGEWDELLDRPADTSPGCRSARPGHPEGRSEAEEDGGRWRGPAREARRRDDPWWERRGSEPMTIRSRTAGRVRLAGSGGRTRRTGRGSKRAELPVKELKEQVNAAVEAAEFARSHRNQRISHKDLDHAIGGSKLPSTTYDLGAATGGAGRGACCSADSEHRVSAGKSV